MKIIRVKMHNEFFYAESDLVRTFACSADPVFFVTELTRDNDNPWSGYVPTESIEQLDALQVHNVKRWLNNQLIGE